MTIRPEIHTHVHLHGLVDHTAQLNHLENLMTTAAEQITDLSGRFDDFAADVRAKLEILNSERENLTPAGQAALDELSVKLDALDTEVGDADNSDVPPTDV